jgi:hypothetical protein
MIPRKRIEAIANSVPKSEGITVFDEKPDGGLRVRARRMPAGEGSGLTITIACDGHPESPFDSQGRRRKPWSVRPNYDGDDTDGRQRVGTARPSEVGPAVPTHPDHGRGRLAERDRMEEIASRPHGVDTAYPKRDRAGRLVGGDTDADVPPDNGRVLTT